MWSGRRVGNYFLSYTASSCISSSNFSLFAATFSPSLRLTRLSLYHNDPAHKTSMKPTIPQSAADIQAKPVSPNIGPANEKDPAPRDAPLVGLASPLPLAVGLL
jgi:hypothetical protein